jgi:hypothetical protein
MPLMKAVLAGFRQRGAEAAANPASDLERTAEGAEDGMRDDGGHMTRSQCRRHLALAPGAQQAADNGDAERAADLEERTVRRGADPGVLDRDRAHDRRSGCRDGQASADAEQHHAGNSVEVGRADRGQRDLVQASADGQQAATI